MIVDDEPNVRLVFQIALESAGYAVVEAADGEEALARLREAPIDLILLDLKMPVLDGMETLRRLREQGNLVPVVIITAHGSIPDAVAAMKLGAIDFLPKPVSPTHAARGRRAGARKRHAGPRPRGPSRSGASPSPHGPAPKPDLTMPKISRGAERPRSRSSSDEAELLLRRRRGPRSRTRPRSPECRR